MNKFTFFTVIACLISSAVCRAQIYTFTTIAGNDTATTYADGVAATSVALTHPSGITTDRAGNVYFLENYYIRKINTITGIITTVCGTGINGYSGDGGPATAAMIDCGVAFGSLGGLCSDNAGNIYIADNNNNRIRKIDATSGIITTVAGSGAGGDSGDGGPASAAAFTPEAIALDGAGNMYISGGSMLRKVDATTGIITTIAGSNTGGFSGDGGPATAALFSDITDIKLDTTGNIYLDDYMNFRVRKVNAVTGIITTVAGGGTGTTSTFGGPATSVSFSFFRFGILVDRSGNLYIADGGYGEIERVDLSTGLIYNAGQTLGGVYYLCVDTSGNIYYSAYDGYIRRLTPHPVLTASFYIDMNSDCIFDSGDGWVYQPVPVEIDSNGIAVDTINALSGCYYIPNGSPGDVYTFKILPSITTGIVLSCPSSGILSDTLQYGVNNYPTNFFAFNCSTIPGFDLGIFISVRTIAHGFWGSVLAYNNYCTPQAATVTVNLSPKFIYNPLNDAMFTIPTPATASGSTLTWNFSGLSDTFAPVLMQFLMEPPSGAPVYYPGDTVNSNYIITPTIGDLNPANNTSLRLDTIEASWDPNFMEVNPQLYLAPGAQLQYTVHFENTGNDTAHHIYVIDTLPDNVDIHSLKMIIASAAMHIMKFTANGHNVIQFDFPNINLPDSSHHGKCDGMFVFTVNAKTGLPNFTTIFNQAGIYFDDNPSVITNTVENIICDAMCGPDYVINIIKNKVAIYPNPTTDELTIKMDKNAYSSFTITNCMGQVLMQQPLSTKQTNINVKMLPAGLYYITLKGENGVKVEKLVKI